MTNLTEEQYILVKQYNELLSTVDEAFRYIIESFQNYERTEGDRLLADVFAAFSQIAQTNEQLVSLLPDEVNAFIEVVKNAGLLDGSFENLEVKQRIICDKLFPAYSVWSTAMQSKLKPLLND